jgi:hypothetical protein
MAKKTAEIAPEPPPTVPVATAPNLDALAAENAALRQQQDQMIDMMVELQEQMAAVKSGVAAPAIVAEAPEDAELRALMEEFKDVPNIQVIEHRLTAGSTDAPAIRLKAAPGGLPEPSVAADPHGETCYWKLRWFNFSIEGRAERFANEGYLKVERAELMDPESVPNLSTIDQYVRKGEKGQEVLGKIPRKIFEYKKRRDAQRQGRLMQSEAGVRNLLANGAASMAGSSGGNADFAGTTIEKQFAVTVTPQQTERVTA